MKIEICAAGGVAREELTLSFSKELGDDHFQWKWKCKADAQLIHEHLSRMIPTGTARDLAALLMKGGD